MTPKDAFFAGWTARANVVATGANFTAADLWDEICARHSPKPAKHALGGWGAFAAALKRVLPAAVTRSPVPILECVLLQSSGGFLTLTCTDMEIALTERIEAPGLADMRVAVPAKLLLDVAKNLPPGGEIAFEATGEKHGGLLKIGGATLATLSAEDFPRGSAPAWQQSFSLPADVLPGALNAVKHGISTEETRYYLNGVHICIQDGRLAFVTSDGHRLFLKSVAIPAGIAELPHIIVGRATIAMLMPLLARFCDVVRIDLTETRMCFSFGAITLTTKLIEGVFPEFNRVIPRDNSLKVVFDAAELIGAVKAVKEISKERSQPVKIDLGPDYCRVSAQSPEYGSWVREVAPLETPGFTAETGFEARYLIDALSCVTGSVQLAFLEAGKKPGVCDPGAPILVTVPGDDLWLSVIMPMRV
jgi:DNA polymerase-3 subunit beta